MAVQLSVEQVFAEITLAVTSQVKNNLSLVLYIQHSCLRTTLSALQVYIKAAYLLFVFWWDYGKKYFETNTYRKIHIIF